MARTTTKLILLAALAATAGCAHKRPKVLPPAAGDVAPPTGPATTGDTVEPGSPQDFQRSVMSDTIHFALDQYDIDAQSRKAFSADAAAFYRKAGE